MKKTVILILLFLAINGFAFSEEIDEKLQPDSLQAVLEIVPERDRESLSEALEDAGTNYEQLADAIYNTDGNQREAAIWLIKNMPHLDRLEMKTEILLEHIDYAYRTQNYFQYSVPDTLFRNYILTYRIAQESVQAWRKALFEYFSPMVSEAKTPADAAAIINQWIETELTPHEYEFFGGQQPPLFTMKTKSGTESEISILTTAILKSIGIPSRNARIAYFAREEGGADWVEIFSEGKWLPLYPLDSQNFGNFHKFEEDASDNVTVVATTSAFERNLVTENYTDTGKIEFRISAHGQPKKNFGHFSVNVFNRGALRPLDDLWTYTDTTGTFICTVGNGQYVVETGIRSKTGDVFVETSHIEVSADSTLIVELDVTPPAIVDQQIDLNIDKEISSFYLSDIDGEIRSDKDGEGKKAMILAIFSGDTEPSKRMLPLINEFYENLEKPEKKKLLLYGIYEGEIENIKEFKEDWALDFPVLIDAEKKLAEPSDELPIVVGLDEHRLIKFYEEGYNLNIKAILQDFISKY